MNHQKRLRYLIRICCHLMLLIILLSSGPLKAQEAPDWQPILDLHFSTEEQYKAAQSTLGADYLTQNEKLTITYTNLARLFPQKFDTFYLHWLREVDEEGGWEKFEKGDFFYFGLHTDLQKMKPMQPLQPGKKQWRTARQWARYSGKLGIVGHHRPSWMRKAKVECCDYNPLDDAMTMVLDLLIDERVKSLGHRRILLGKYIKVGASIQPHKGYGWCLVLDFE